MQQFFTELLLFSSTVITTVTLYQKAHFPPCLDDYPMCHYLSIIGECEKPSIWMDFNCKDSCKARMKEMNLTNKERERRDEYREWLLKVNEFVRQYKESNSNPLSHTRMKKFRTSLPESESEQITSRCKFVLAKYHVQVLNYNTGYLCGGAVIAPYVVITAAHCVVNQMDVNSIRFHVIISSLEKENGHRVRISKIIIHENYLNNVIENDKLSYDIALIFVEEEIPSNNIIGLANRAERVGESGNLSGFGEYNDLGNYFPYDLTLEETELTVLEDRFDDTPTMFITSGQLKKGDIGGLFLGRRW